MKKTVQQRAGRLKESKQQATNSSQSRQPQAETLQVLHPDDQPRILIGRIIIGVFLGLAIGYLKFGWDPRTQPLVLEYGLVMGSLAFALQNYMRFRRRILAKIQMDLERQAAEGASAQPTS